MAVRRLELDAVGVKALAHPLRLAVMRVLELHDRVSVTSLATELGESTGTISYHLRQLAHHGLVEQCPPGDAPAAVRQPVQEGGVVRGRAGRKQVWWRMAVDEIHMSGLALQQQEGTREAAGFLLREFASTRSRRLAHWFATAANWPPEWQRASSDMDGQLVLSPAQARALADEMAAIVSRYRQVAPEEGGRRVEVQYAVFPSETGQRP